MTARRASGHRRRRPGGVRAGGRAEHTVCRDADGEPVTGSRGSQGERPAECRGLRAGKVGEPLRQGPQHVGERRERDVRLGIGPASAQQAQPVLASPAGDMLQQRRLPHSRVTPQDERPAMAREALGQRGVEPADLALTADEHGASLRRGVGAGNPPWPSGPGMRAGDSPGAFRNVPTGPWRRTRFPKKGCTMRFLRPRWLAGALGVAAMVTFTSLSGTAATGPAPGTGPQPPTSPVPGDVVSIVCDGVPATIVGTNGVDSIHGTPGRDVIQANGGNDNVFGHGGDDLICGGPGIDQLYGGPGDDTVFGGDDGDLIRGQGGNDTLRGEHGSDVVLGGTGADDLDGGDDIDRMTGGSGADTLHGGAGDDVLTGGPGNDLVYGGGTANGDDPTGRDTINGQAGSDRLYGGAANDRINGGPGVDSIFGQDGDDGLTGGSGNDQMYGGDDDDVMIGGPGNDNMFGSLGDDRLFGRGGADSLRGQDDDDHLDGGPGREKVCDGGSGTNVIVNCSP